MSEVLEPDHPACDPPAPPRRWPLPTEHQRFELNHQSLLLGLAVGVLFASILLSVEEHGRVVVPGLQWPLPTTCSFRRLSGHDCPGCGLTRSFVSLAHGQWHQAWGYNPAGPLWFALVAVQVPYRWLQIRRLREGKPFWTWPGAHWILGLAVVVLIGQWVWREGADRAMVKRVVPLETGQIHLLDAGQGVPLLLVHGFPLDQSMWTAQLEGLASHCRVLTPDLRGFGQSRSSAAASSLQQAAADLAQMLDRLQIGEPVILGGLSMGGYIAWQFWQHHRARLAGLILCDTRAAADAPEVAAGRERLAERVLQEGVAGAVHEMLPRLVAPATLQSAPDRVDALRQVMEATLPATYAAAQRAMARRPEMSARLPAIDVPTLVICGHDDQLTPPAEMRAMAAAIPGADYHEVPQAGHLAPWEQPQSVNVALLEFLKRI